MIDEEVRSFSLHLLLFHNIPANLLALGPVFAYPKHKDATP
jgi:hypothetical protein